MPMFSGQAMAIDLEDEFGNTAAYAVGSWMVESNAPQLNCANTEGRAGHSDFSTSAKGFAANLGGLKEAAVRLTQVTFDNTQNVFGTPLDIQEGRPFKMTMYPDGRPTDPAPFNIGTIWPFEGLVCNKIRSEGEAKGLQPLTIEACTDGFYSFGANREPPA